MRKTIEDVQRWLLEVEHETVAQVMKRARQGDRFIEVPKEYYEPLFCPTNYDKAEELLKAKKWAVETYPNW